MSAIETIAVAIVTWNNERHIAECLDALDRQETPRQLVTCVVDNASTDDTVEIARKHLPWHGRVVASASNLGYAAGNLAALAELGPADAVLLLNPDCVLAPDAVERLAQHLDEDASAAAAAASLRDPDGRLQYFARREPAFGDAAWWFLATLETWDRRRGGARKARRELHGLVRASTAEPFVVDIPAAAGLLLRSSALPVPVLDPAFRLFFNDVDLFRRLRDGGWHADVVPAATAVHAHGASHRQLAADAKRAEQVHGLRTYVRTWWPRPAALLLDVLLFLDALSCLTLSTRGRNRTRWRRLGRGTLGGLGLPGGTPPFLSAGHTPRALPPRPAPTRAS
jgi:GT2 family glycosyltransferase